MKKVIALIMCVAMILSVSVFTVSAADTDRITLTTTAKVSDPVSGTGTLTVTVSLSENTGVNTVVLDMGYNASTLKFTSVTNGDVFSDANNGNMISNTEKNPIRIFCEDNGIENNTKTGKLVIVKFDIIDDMGSFDITVTPDEENTFAKGTDITPVDVQITNNVNITKNTQHVNTALPITIKPTCTEAGRIEKRCSTCNKLLSTVPSGNPLGHEWEEVDRKNATRTEDGYVEYECSRCSEEKTEIIPKGTPSPNAATLNGTYKITDDTLTVTLTLGKNPGINTLVANLGYNAEALELVSIANGDVFSAANNGSMVETNKEKNPLILYFEENSIGNIKANGTVAKITFKILDAEADFGFTLAVDENNTIACGEGYVPEEVEFAPCGEITEMNFIIGDINDDGKVNAVDINLIKRIVTGALVPTAEEFAAADINGDGKVNAVDINLLKRMVLSGNA